MYDVAIVGGSYAGMSAALQLARARRSVLMLDAGTRRNRFAAHAHGLLGFDGQTPAAIADQGKADVLAYPTVTWKEQAVRAISKTASGFSVRTAGGEYASKRVILATGVSDTVPTIPGLAERWGQSVFHCPYCHGYELNRGRLAVLATNALAVHQASLVNEWASHMTLLLNGVYEPTSEEYADLAARGIVVERETVIEVKGNAPKIELVLNGGRALVFDGLFLMPKTSPATAFAEQLGCALEEGPLGPYYRTDMTKETTVPGVFACGDTATPFGALSFAIADGTMAGSGAHRSLVFAK